MCLSAPYLVFCDVQITNSNENNQTYEIIEECIATSNTTIMWNYISGWYTTIFSYIIPVIIISFCYVRILKYVSRNSMSSANNSIVRILKYMLKHSFFFFKLIFLRAN